MTVTCTGRLSNVTALSVSAVKSAERVKRSDEGVDDKMAKIKIN